LVTAFREDSTGALLTVLRGWVAEKDPAYLDLPDGDVTVMGFIDGSEAAETGIRAEPGGEIDSISVGALVNVWGGPIYSGYIILVSAEPAAGAPGAAPDGLDPVAAMPPPVLPSGGLNLRNIAYAAEWFVFGGFALVLWGRMVRDEVRAQRGARQAAAAAA